MVTKEWQWTIERRSVGEEMIVAGEGQDERRMQETFLHTCHVYVMFFQRGLTQSHGHATIQYETVSMLYSSDPATSQVSRISSST